MARRPERMYEVQWREPGGPWMARHVVTHAGLTLARAFECWSRQMRRGRRPVMRRSLDVEETVTRFVPDQVSAYMLYREYELPAVYEPRAMIKCTTE